MMAVDAFIDNDASGVATLYVYDDSDSTDATNVIEANDVTIRRVGTRIRIEDNQGVFSDGSAAASGAGFAEFEVADFDNLRVDLQDDDDTLRFADSFTSVGINNIRVIGGDPGASDTLFLDGTAGVAQTVTIDPDSGNADITNIVGYAAITIDSIGNEQIVYNGSGGDDVLNVVPGPVGSSRVQNAPDDQRGRITSDTLPVIEWNALQTFRLSHGGVTDTRVDTFVLEDLFDATNFEYSGNNDQLVIEGGPVNSNWTIQRVGANLSITSSTGLGVRAITVLNGTPDAIRFNALGGNDTLNVINTAGLINVPLFFDGGEGNDVLNLGGTTAVDASVYTPGPADDSGEVVHTLGGASQVVRFAGLEPVIDVVPAATLVVNGTNADNAINYRQGSVATNGLVSVDNFETIEFSNKATLVINGLAGDDTINLNNPSVPTGLTGITIDGADPTGSDTLIVNGRVNVVDDFNYTPTNSDSGTVAHATRPTVTFSNIEDLQIDGQNDNTVTADTLTVTTTSINGTNVLTPGSQFDSGLLEFRDGGGPLATAASVAFRRLGVGGSLTIAGVRNDNMIYRGTDRDDTFTLTAAGAVTLNTQIVVNTPAIEALTLTGLDGDDTFNVAASHNLDTLIIEGGNPDAVDFLIVTGTAALAETFTINPRQTRFDGILEVNVSTTIYTSIEKVVLLGNDGDNDDVFIGGTRANETRVVERGPQGRDRTQVEDREFVDFDGFMNATLTPGTDFSSGADIFKIYPTGLQGSVNLTIQSQVVVPTEIRDDVVEIYGTEAIDVITSTADTFSVNPLNSPEPPSTTVTLAPDGADGFAFAEVRVFGLGGADSIDLDLNLPQPVGIPAVNKVVDGGAGDDNINLAGMADADVFGGAGNDTIVGTPLSDNIYGGFGNDILIGGGGVDFIYGEEGNDRFGDPAIADPAANDPGNDFFYGGPGADRFVWDPGDGSDTIVGGEDGGDVLEFHGNAGAEQFHLFASLVDPSHFILFRAQGAITMTNTGVEQVDLLTLGGADTVTVGRSNVAPNQLSTLQTTEVKVVNIDVGPADAAADSVIVEGRALNDNLLVSLSNNVVTVQGLPYDVKLRSTVAGAGGDTLTVNGNEGDDTIKSEDQAPGVESVVNIVFNGNAGNDILSADAILNGGLGNDFLEGGAGDDTINGNEGDDVMLGGGGADTFDGGTGVDTILVRGTVGNDAISINQTAATTLVHTVNGNTQTDTLVLVAGVETVERVKVEALDGDDTISVTWLDALGADAVNNALRVDVDGGNSPTRDRIGVIDNGTGDLILYRRGVTDNDGSMSINPSNPVEALDATFVSVEFAQPLFDNGAGGVSADPAVNGGDVVVFKHDPYEFNDLRVLATHLGAGDAINVDPTIDPGLDPIFGFPEDIDWYRVVAERTGVLDFQVYFRHSGPVPSGRPGLPQSGNLQIQVFGANGLPVGGIVGFGVNDNTDDERVRIPAVAGQTYYLRVFGLAPTTINNYNITVDNYAPPTPYDLELNDILAVGQVSAVVNATQFSVADIAGQPPLANIDDFYNGKYVQFIVSAGNALTLQRARVLDYIGATQTFILTPDLTAAPAVGDRLQVETHDTGRSQFDDVTRDSTPVLRFRLDDAIFLHDLPGNPDDDTPPDEVIPIPFNPQQTAIPTVAGYRVAVFVEGTPQSSNGQLPQVPVGYARQIAEGVYEFDFDTDSIDPNFVLNFDGSFFISARVQIVDPQDLDPVAAGPQRATGFGPRSVSLEVVVDTQAPPVFFGLPANAADGLIADSDSGVIPPNPDTIVDGITNDVTPTVWGSAEANTVIRLYAERNPAILGSIAGVVDPTDVFLGMAVAIPNDGTNQFPGGFWTIESIVNLNDPNFFNPVDGLRTLLVTAEDLAGNINPAAGQAQQLRIFIDTQGPQITGVVVADDPGYDLFDPKPSTDGPTPLVNSIIINVRDLPNRLAPDFLYRAIKEDVASVFGHYQVKGDANGIIPIVDINAINLPVQNGQPALATIELVFRDAGPDGVFDTSDDVGRPLPDDRFTLFVNDEGVRDIANNKLDGESNASEPQENPTFPSGDGIPGGDFVARFTVDSRPELGTNATGVVHVDTNGNFIWDPQNLDFTNRDITYQFGFTSDDVVAGNFSPVGAAAGADGFDKLAAYGMVNNQFRWLIDINNDGVPDYPASGVDPNGVNGVPIAGEFDGNLANGDEVGIFTGTRYIFDTNHDYRLDPASSFVTSMRGRPVVGDFNGDGFDDLAVWAQDRFQITLAVGAHRAWPADPQFSFNFGLIGVRERPVAADMNQDGLADLGLWSPDRTGQVSSETAEWHWLLSDPTETPNGGAPNNLLDAVIDDVDGDGRISLLERIVPDIDLGGFTIDFEPTPFGQDFVAYFGDEFAGPVVGNFDPPITPGEIDNEIAGPYTVNEGGQVALSGSATGGSGNYTYSWDLDGDGNYGETGANARNGNETGASPTFRAGDVDGGPGAAWQVRMYVTDSSGNRSHSTLEQITVNNVAPTIGPITGAPSGLTGQALEYTFSATDPSFEDSQAIAYTIDWKGDGSEMQTVIGPASGVTVTHFYGAAGNFKIKAKASDNDGGVSSLATFDVNIASEKLANGALSIGGTSGDDNIRFAYLADGRIRYNRNGTGWSPAMTVNGITVYGGLGNDTIALPEATIPGVLYGGPGEDRIYGGLGADIIYGDAGRDYLDGRIGNDKLYGGDGDDQIMGGQGNDVIYAGAGNDRVRGYSGNDLVYGEAGRDVLTAGTGNDVLVGGEGNDRVYGEFGTNLLLGGAGRDIVSSGANGSLIVPEASQYDSGNDAALLALMAEWGSSRSFTARVNNILGIGSGPRANGNVFLRLGTEVQNDGFNDPVTGSVEADLFYHVPGTIYTSGDGPQANDRTA